MMKCQRCGSWMTEDNERWVTLDEKCGPRRQWHICDECEADATELMTSFMEGDESLPILVDEFSDDDILGAELTELYDQVEQWHGNAEWWRKKSCEWQGKYNGLHGELFDAKKRIKELKNTLFRVTAGEPKMCVTCRHCGEYQCKIFAPTSERRCVSAGYEHWTPK